MPLVLFLCVCVRLSVQQHNVTKLWHAWRLGAPRSTYRQLMDSPLYIYLNTSSRLEIPCMVGQCCFHKPPREFWLLRWFDSIDSLAFCFFCTLSPTTRPLAVLFTHIHRHELTAIIISIFISYMFCLTVLALPCMISVDILTFGFSHKPTTDFAF